MAASIVFRRAIPKDRNAFRTALTKFFYPEEPMTKYYYAGTEVTPDDMEYSLSALKEGLVTLAVNETTGGNIVGVCCGSFIEPNEVDKMIELASRTETQKFRDILLLLARLTKEANIFERYGVSKVYHMHSMGVDPNVRGRALAQTLVEQQMDYALSCGAKVACGDATGFYSKMLLERAGMETIHSIPYEDYKNEQGQQVFLSKAPHLELRKMIKILDNGMSKK